MLNLFDGLFKSNDTFDYSLFSEAVLKHFLFIFLNQLYVAVFQLSHYLPFFLFGLTIMPCIDSKTFSGRLLRSCSCI